MTRHQLNSKTIWITGVTASGKTTLGEALHKRILQEYSPEGGLTIEELSIQYELEKGYEVSGRAGAQRALDQIFSGERKIPEVSQAWIEACKSIYSDVGAQPEISQFLQKAPIEQKKLPDPPGIIPMGIFF